MLRAMRVLVVFASATGRTARMAEALAQGAREAGAEAVLLPASEAQPAQLEAADAIVLGSGVHMGGIESAMAAFFERTAPLWIEGRLVGRVGAAFASAGQGGRGGGELALVRLLAWLAENGLIIVPMHNRLEGFRQGGCHWGPLAWTNPRRGEAGPTEAHLAACRAHGRFVAQCAARWLAGAPGVAPPARGGGAR